MPCSRKALHPASTRVKPPHRVDREGDLLVDGPRESRFGYGDEGGVVAPGGEDPLDRVGPLDEDPTPRLEGPDDDVGPDAVHLPVPVHRGARLQAPAPPGEPEAAGEGRVDEGFEDLADRAADEHLGPGDRFGAEGHRAFSGEGGCASAQRGIVKRAPMPRESGHRAAKYVSGFSPARSHWVYAAGATSTASGQMPE